MRGQDRLNIGQVLFLLACSSQRVESHKLSQKKNESVKDLLYGFQRIFCARHSKSSVFPTRVANYSAAFDSSWPLTEHAIDFFKPSCFVGVVVGVIHLQGDGDSSKLAPGTAPILEMAQAYGLRLWLLF